MPVIPVAITARNRKHTPWAEFVASLDEIRHLARKIILTRCILLPKYSTLRKPLRMLSALQLVWPRQRNLLADALVGDQDMYRKQSRKVPAAAPLGCRKLAQGGDYTCGY